MSPIDRLTMGTCPSDVNTLVSGVKPWPMDNVDHKIVMIKNSASFLFIFMEISLIRNKKSDGKERLLFIFAIVFVKGPWRG